MFYVEIAARIFQCRIVAVLRKELADIVGIVVEGMRISVGGQERESVRGALLQRRLQAIVIGFIEVRQDEDGSQIGEFYAERRDLGDRVRLVDVSDSIQPGSMA